MIVLKLGMKLLEEQLVGLKVKLAFDPPTNSTLLQSINDQIKDLEWRLYIWKDMQRLYDQDHPQPEPN